MGQKTRRWIFAPRTRCKTGLMLPVSPHGRNSPYVILFLRRRRVIDVSHYQDFFLPRVCYVTLRATAAFFHRQSNRALCFPAIPALISLSPPFFSSFQLINAASRARSVFFLFSRSVRVVLAAGKESPSESSSSSAHYDRRHDSARTR